MAAMINWADRRQGLFLGFGGIVIVVALEANEIFRSKETPPNAALTISLTAVIAVLWVVLMVRFRRPVQASPLGPVLIVAMGAASIGLLLVSPQGGSIIPAIFALAAGATRFQGRGRMAFAAALIVAYLAGDVAVNGLRFIPILSLGLGLTFAAIAAGSIARLRAEESRAKSLVRELQASRDAQVEAAALNERARIAREIHDVLAHTLAAEAVQLESARVMLEQRGGDPEALAAVERAHRLTREGLDEVRRAVSALRGDRIPGPDQLRELVSTFESDTGVEADFKIEGASRVLTSEAQLAVYRSAQEALTNVRKHADASRVEVALRYLTGGTELEVIDVGTNRQAMNGAGYGLIGMRERAELLGGTLEAGATESGFRVRLWIPA